MQCITRKALQERLSLRPLIWLEEKKMAELTKLDKLEEDA